MKPIILLKIQNTLSDHLNIPENYQAVMPYLVVDHAREFLKFTQSVFGAKLLHHEHPEEQLIRHAEITIHGSVIMFADSTAKIPARNAGLFIYVNNADETYKKALKCGATSLRPPSDQSYGRTCGIEDPFGNTWWITSVLS